MLLVLLDEVSALDVDDELELESELFELDEVSEVELEFESLVVS